MSVYVFPESLPENAVSEAYLEEGAGYRCWVKGETTLRLMSFCPGLGKEWFFYHGPRKPIDVEVLNKVCWKALEDYEKQREVQS